MEGSDFIEWLGSDMSIKILVCLEDPSDVVRFSAVSSSWRQFVIANGISKQLYLKMFPEMSNVAHVIETSNTIEPVEFGPDESMQWAYLRREHKVFSFLARGLTPFLRTDCISGAISASSTDNYPAESIQNTLEPGDMTDQTASYWSSKGESDPGTSERLTYKLTSKMCVVTEVRIQPFQAFFQFGFPIYSAKAVRFLMGHPKVGMEEESKRNNSSAAHGSCCEMLAWTYISPDFPMAQENCLQKFKLPEPVICLGGFFQIELLGRVQKQETDTLYYTCISHVEVVGHPLSLPFDVEFLDRAGRCKLKFHGDQNCQSSYKCNQGEPSSPSRFRRFSASLRGWEQMIVNTLLGTGAVLAVDDDNSEDGNLD